MKNKKLMKNLYKFLILINILIQVTDAIVEQGEIEQKRTDLKICAFLYADYSVN